MKNTRKTYDKLTQVTLYGAVGVMLAAISSPSLLAQEVKSAINSKKKEQQNIEVIEVTGVRSSLESALNTKRSANTIVDAISAEDIDVLPALDLGEALQAIPGIQVNRDGERRQSEINLRGLPGGYTKITANGQSFASPSRSTGFVGSSNPFGSFEAGVFNGVTVIKAPTADLQEGGIAGVVDKKLQRALSRPDGRFQVSLGGRYEELDGSFDKKLAMSGVKHLIKDELAVAFKLSASEQNFRRDTIHVNNYDNAHEGAFAGLDEWKAANGLPEDAIVKVPRDLRQVVEKSAGDRISFTGNIEWKPTDDLKLGADLLFTRRDLGDNKWEQFNLGARIDQNQSRHNAEVQYTPRSEPFYWGEGENGEPIYGVSAVEITNVDYSLGNRIFNLYEEAKGVFLNADYIKGDWELEGKLSYSESENNFNQTGMDVRFRGSRANSIDPTGANIYFNTGAGNLADYQLDITGLNPNLDRTWNGTNPWSYSVAADRSGDDKLRADLYVFGGFLGPSREMSAADFSAKRYLDIQLLDGGLKFESVKFGGRYSSEELKNTHLQPTAAGINLDNIGNHLWTQDTITTTSTQFFDGRAPGYFTTADGWWSMDTDYVASQLQEGIVAPEGTFIIPEVGFASKVDRSTGALSVWGNNFQNKQEITALFAMTDFSGEVGDIFFSGNVGVRYVTTDNTIDGSRRETDDSGDRIVPYTVEQDYSHALPSFNLAIELTDDIVLRSAASKGLVRPNLLSQNPAVIYTENESSIRIDYPKSNVGPYEAEMFDLSLEWYNREGSAVTIGVFRKEIEGLFGQRELCPANGSSPFAADLGSLEREEIAGGGFNCYQSEAYEQEDGDLVNRRVRIREYYNSDDTIKVTGYELAMQQKLDFLPYPWNGFGGVLNYSYVETESNGEDALYRISPNSYNAIAYWENDGVSLRLAYNYRDNYALQGGSSIAGADDKNVVARGQLDFSAGYRYSKHLRFNLRGHNLTNEIRMEYTGMNEEAVRKINYDGRTYTVSATYTF